MTAEREAGWVGAGTLAIEPSHCGQPMRWTQSHTSWNGPEERNQRRYECVTCPAELVVLLTEHVPLPAPAADREGRL